MVARDILLRVMLMLMLMLMLYETFFLTFVLTVRVLTSSSKKIQDTQLFYDYVSPDL
jgi:hypothetical protein